MAVTLKTFFDSKTSAFTHVIYDMASRKAAVIDSVLDYDPSSGCVDTQSADQVIAYVNEENLSVQWILETHVHADHITASRYLKEKIGGTIGMGRKVKDVLELWVPFLNTEKDTPLDGSQFDHLFEDGETFVLGTIEGTVLYTPGHTPSCYSYLIEDVLFLGDTLLMPDIGTARTDFPGGSADVLYDSIQRILSLPESTRLLMCHDYPPAKREIAWMTTIKEQKENNVHVHDGVSKDTYVQMRCQLDQGKAVPKLLLPSIQANLRAGAFGLPEENNVQYIKIPINKIKCFGGGRDPSEVIPPWMRSQSSEREE